MELLKHQEAIKNIIIEDLKNGEKLFIIEGVSGTGKTYLMNSMIKEIMNENNFEFFIMEGDNQCLTRDYYPIEQCLAAKKKIQKDQTNNIKTIISKTVRSIPSVGYPAEFVVKEILNHKNNNVVKLNSHLNESEMNIIFRIKHFIKNKIIFYIDNLHWWDEKSIALLYQFLKEKEGSLSFLRNAIFIINWTTDQSSIQENFKKEISRKFDFKNYKLEVTEKENYRDVLQAMGLEKQINKDLINALYSITGGHLQLTIDIIRYINETSLEVEELSNLVATSDINTLIEERLKNYGAKGEVVTEVLKYASIIGLSFTFMELEKITKKTKIEIQEIIEEANKLHFVIDIDTKTINFVHEIIRELFNNQLGDNQTKYYESYAECLKIIKPNDYLTRATFLLKAKSFREAALLYTIAYIKKLRNQENISIEFKRQLSIFSKELRIEDYLYMIENAYKNYHNKQFDNAIKNLELIEDFHPILLLAEKDYLLSLCLTKKIDRHSREKSVEILSHYNDIATLLNENELWSRILSLQMISYIHINDKDNAIKLEKIIVFHLNDRVDFDSDAEDKINILRRKSSSVHSIAFAQRRTKQSVEYFGPIEEGGIPLNPIQYYYSLNNHVANTLVLGEFEQSFKDANILMDFIRDYSDIDFPRTEIPLNNYILSGLASQNISQEKALEIYSEIFENIKLSADSILMRINQAVLYAGNNQLNVAFNILSELKLRLIKQSNIELYYQYYVDSNLMVVEYLLGNESKALKIWEEMNYMPSIGIEKYYKKRHAILKELFDSNIKATGYEWLTILEKNYPEFIENTEEKSYSHGFLTTDIQFWSES